MTYLGIDFFIVFNGTGIILTTLLLLVILSRKISNPVAKWTSVLIALTYVLVIKTYLLGYLLTPFWLPVLVLITLPLGFLAGPVYRLHFLSFTSGKSFMKPADWLHFIPTGIAVLICSGIAVWLPDINILIDNPPKSDIIWIFWVGFSSLISIHWMVYLVIFSLEFKSWVLSLNGEDRKDLVTQAKVRFFLTMGIVFLLITITYGYTFVFRGGPIGLMLISLLLTAQTLLLVWHLLQHPGWFYIPDELQKRLEAVERHKSGPESFLLKELNRRMVSECLYRDPDLTLSRLAELVNLQPQVLSELINTGLDVNFNDFINRFRVDEVKSMFADPAYSGWKILSVGLEAGFNSKATFYQAFRKQTGMTPTEYKDRLLLTENSRD